MEVVHWKPWFRNGLPGRPSVHPPGSVLRSAAGRLRLRFEPCTPDEILSGFAPRAAPTPRVISPSFPLVTRFEPRLFNHKWQRHWPDLQMGGVKRSIRGLFPVCFPAHTFVPLRIQLASARGRGFEAARLQDECGGALRPGGQAASEALEATGGVGSCCPNATERVLHMRRPPDALRPLPQ